MDIQIDPQACTRCGACVALCTGRVFTRGERVEATAPEECWLCGHCVATCPADAVRHSGYPLADCPPLDPSVLPTLDALVAALRERRSARVFRDKPLPRALVEELVDVTRWAPSASNDQPVDWLAVDEPARIAALSTLAVDALAHTAHLLRNRLLRPFLYLALGARQLQKGLESVDSFERLAERHAAGEDPIFFRAPLVLLAHTPDLDHFGRDDAVYAAYNLMLAAQRHGLGTCHIGYFLVALERSAALRRALDLPPERRVQVVLVAGYPRYRFHRAPSRRQQEIVWA